LTILLLIRLNFTDIYIEETKLIKMTIYLEIVKHSATPAQRVYRFKH